MGPIERRSKEQTPSQTGHGWSGPSGAASLEEGGEGVLVVCIRQNHDLWSPLLPMSWRCLKISGLLLRWQARYVSIKSCFSWCSEVDEHSTFHISSLRFFSSDPNFWRSSLGPSVRASAVQVNERNFKGQTPLHIASMQGGFWTTPSVGGKWDGLGFGREDDDDWGNFLGFLELGA